MTRPALFPLFLLLAAVGAPADASRDCGPEGTRARVRITSVAGEPGEPLLRGWLLPGDPGRLTLCLEGGEIRTLPVERVAQLELSGGRHARHRNALIGAGIGALAAVATTLVWRSATDDPEAAVGVGFGLFLYTPLVAGVGAGIGLMVPPGERWEPETVPRPVHPAIALSLRF